MSGKEGWGSKFNRLPGDWLISTIPFCTADAVSSCLVTGPEEIGVLPRSLESGEDVTSKVVGVGV